MKERLEYVLAGRDELTRPLKQAEAQMKSVERTAKRTGVQMNQFGGALTGAGKDLRKFAMGGLQQAGYQVGDFAVQVANGTSKMQAFGQQAPQLLQIFGPFGAILGAAVSIFAAFGVAAEKMSGQAKSAADGLDKLKTSVLLYKEAAERAVMPTEDLIETFGDYAQEMRAGLVLLREFRASDAFDMTKMAVDALNLEMEGLVGNILDFKKIAEETNSMGILADDLEKAAEEFNLTTTQASILAKSLAQMSKASDLDELIESGNNFRTLLQMVYQDTSLIPKAMRDVAQNVIVANLAAADLAKSFGDVGDNVEYSNDRIKILLDRVAKAREVIFDPRDPRYNKIAVMMAQMNEENDKGTKKAAKSAANLRKRIIELTPEMVRAQKLGESVGKSFENAMMGAVRGTMSVKDAFRNMATDIISELYRVFVVKKITGFISDFVGMAALPAGGSYTGTGGLPRFDGGGYTGNGARSGGIDGKGGFMAMLHPRETVVDHTKGQGGGVTVVQNINVSTGVQQTVRTEIKSLMPQIAESAKAAVADAKRRGGSYGRAFA